VVIGEHFAWAHLQKTAGDATLLMFRLFPNLIVHADPRNVQDKHATFAERASAVEGKILACNIRRLPDWALSFSQHHARYGQRPDGSPLPMNSPHRMVEIAHADSRLSRITDSGRFRVDRWIRMEHLAEDFATFLSEFTELTDGDRERIAASRRVNEIHYDHDIGHWFTPAQVRKMYANNPLWAALEEQVYGDLALLD
jgi:hypothetical protein